MEELADKAKAPVLHGEDIKDHRCLYRIPYWLEIDKAEGDEIILKPRIISSPKTINDCLYFLKLDPRFLDGVIGYRGKDLSALQKLLICRDAYWKIAGEQMGLGKPWKPDWIKPSEMKFCIVNSEGNITKWVQKTTNKILAFPTEEMRDAFYENFKELIELVKELL